MATLDIDNVLHEVRRVAIAPLTWVYGVVGLLIWIVFYRLFLHPLAGVPGPFVARFTGLWRTTKYFQGTWYQDILGLHKKYGRVVRIAPNEVSFVDGEALKRIYGHGKPCKKVHSLTYPPLRHSRGLLGRRNGTPRGTNRIRDQASSQNRIPTYTPFCANESPRHIP